VFRALTFAFLLSTAAAAQQAPHALSLEEAVKLSLDRNPDLLKQVLLSLSSEQDKIVARSTVLPSLTFNASLGGARQSGAVYSGGVFLGQQSSTYSTGGASLTLRQLVFDGGKWWNNLDAADLTLSAGRAQVDEQRLQITYLVEQRFYELVRARRSLSVLTEAAARSRDQADFTQRLFEGGRGTQADVYAARANRDNDEVARLGQERVVELARVDLALGIGLDPSEPLTVVEPPRIMDDPAQPPAAQEAVTRALQNRPSIRAASLTVEANRKTASAAKGDYWPSLSVQGQWSRNAVDDLGILTHAPGRDSLASASVNLQWNVFSGFLTDANVRKAEITALSSEVDLVNGRRNVASDVEKAVAQLATARAQARVAVQAEQNAQDGLRLARTRQEVGVGTQLEVRDAELKLTQAQLSRVGALVDGREAEAALRRAQGG
jgi:outer membrane protein TolC